MLFFLFIHGHAWENSYLRKEVSLVEVRNLKNKIGSFGIINTVVLNLALGYNGVQPL